MAAHSRNTDVFTISLPPELAAQVRRTAEAEHRSISELFRECYRAYRQQRIRSILGESHAAFREFARENNWTEDEMRDQLEQAIREVKAARRAKRSRAS